MDGEHLLIIMQTSTIVLLGIGITVTNPDPASYSYAPESDVERVYYDMHA